MTIRNDTDLIVEAAKLIRPDTPAYQKVETAVAKIETTGRSASLERMVGRTMLIMLINDASKEVKA